MKWWRTTRVLTIHLWLATVQLDGLLTRFIISETVIVTILRVVETKTYIITILLGGTFNINLAIIVADEIIVVG